MVHDSTGSVLSFPNADILGFICLDARKIIEPYKINAAG